MQLQVESGKKIISDLESREKSYIQRLSDLEQQLQHEREKSETILPLQEHNDEITNLMKSIEELTAQQERLQIALSERVKIYIENNSLEIYKETPRTRTLQFG